MKTTMLGQVCQGSSMSPYRSCLSCLKPSGEIEVCPTVSFHWRRFCCSLASLIMCWLCKAPCCCSACRCSSNRFVSLAGACWMLGAPMLLYPPRAAAGGWGFDRGEGACCFARLLLFLLLLFIIFL